MNKNKETEKEKEKEKEIIEETEATEEEAETAETSAEAAEKPDPKEAEIAQLKEQLMRNMAEYDNYRKRTAKEKSELMPEITARVVTDFLPIIDNFERALNAECTDENYKAGVKMIYDSFMEVFDKLGVEKVPTEDFDPVFHQAVQMVEPPEGQESGKIAQVFQNGYKIGAKVLRFAMVTVYQ